MPVNHIVLVKLKPDAPAETIQEFTQTARSMVGQIPGLQKLECGPPLPITAHRSKGYDFGLVAVLDKPSDVEVYAKHPAHLHVLSILETVCEQDRLAFDFEY